MQNRLTKTLTVSSAALLMLTIMAVSYNLWQSHQHIQSLRETYFPLIEVNASILRWQDKLSYRLKGLARHQEHYEVSQNELIENMHILEALDDTVDRFYSLVDQAELEFKESETSREELRAYEEEILHHLEQGNYQTANALLQTENYRDSLEEFIDRFALISEQLSEQRTNLLAKQEEFIAKNVIALGIMVLVSTFIWLLFWKAYRRNFKWRIQAEEKAEEERMKTLHASRMAALGEMASGIAHEINNPLTVILSQAEELQEEACTELNSERLKESSHRIENTAIRISRIISGLKNFGREEHNLPYEVVTIQSLIEAVFDLCDKKFKSHGIEVKTNLTASRKAIECHPIQVQQVIMNLLNNAYDAIESQESPWIRIKTEVEEDYAWISISDSGSKIPDEIVEKMMQPFFTTKETGKGTGLGLSVSKGIVESHGGELFYDSHSEWTRFVIKLPIKQNHPQQQAS